MSDAAALGLGLSGHPSALALLRKRESAEKNPARKDVLATAIAQNARVEQLGLRGHYTLPVANYVVPSRTPSAGPSGPVIEQHSRKSIDSGWTAGPESIDEEEPMTKTVFALLAQFLLVSCSGAQPSTASLADGEVQPGADSGVPPSPIS